MDHEWLLTSIPNDPNIDVLYHFLFWIIEQKAVDLRRKSLLCLFFAK